MIVTHRSGPWVWHLAILGALAGVMACGSHIQTLASGQRTGMAAGSRPAHRSRQEAHAIQLTYHVGPAPECSNWYASLRKAREWAGCDLSTNSGSPQNACQKRVQGCDGGCDVCEILAPGLGPAAEFEDLGPLVRIGNVVGGLRGKQSIFTSSSIFNSRLCEDMTWVDVLGSTMIHEAFTSAMAGGASWTSGLDSRDARPALLSGSARAFQVKEVSE